jgi:predicted transcriptional regulator
MLWTWAKTRRSQARLARLEQAVRDPRLTVTQRRALDHMIIAQRAALKLRVMTHMAHMIEPRHYERDAQPL